MKEIIFNFYVKDRFIEDKEFMASMIRTKLKRYLSEECFNKITSFHTKKYTPYNTKEMRNLVLVTISINF